MLCALAYSRQPAFKTFKKRQKIVGNKIEGDGRFKAQKTEKSNR